MSSHPSSDDPELASRNPQPATSRPIVVAEDGEGLNLLICRRLQRHGLAPVGVLSGADAIAAVEKHPDCLLLLDFVLPDMDGRKVVEELIAQGRPVPFIVMTGHGDEQVAVEMMKLGARDYVVKQDDFTDLLVPVVERTLAQIATQERLAASEAALRESEERFRRAFEDSGIGKLLTGLDGRLLRVNRAFAAMLGYTVEELQTMDFTTATHPDDVAANREVLARMETGTEGSARFEKRYLHRNGSVVWADLSLVLLRDAAGRPYHFVADVQVITDRKRAEERDRQHLTDIALLRDTAVGFIQLAPDANVYQYVADRLSALVGEAYVIVNSHDETTDEFTVRAIAGIGTRLETTLKVMGRNPIGTVFKLAPEHRTEYASEKLLKFEDDVSGPSYGTLPKVLSQIIEKTCDSGSVYAIGFHWQGRVLGTVNIIVRRGADVHDPGIVEAFVNQAAIAVQHRRDADELDRHRVRLEELVRERTAALEHAQAQLVMQEKLATLGRVAGTIAHELRNPLGAIRNASYFLQTTVADKLEGKPAQHLRIIDEYVERANAVITMILDFTWRQQDQPPKEHTLRQLIERAVAEAAIPATVNVVLDVEPSLPQVFVDEKQMVAVFRNLFVNAAQAMPGGGTLRLAARRQGSTVAVDVADTGSGIRPEHLDRLFHALFTTKDVGIGLGLAICKEFVEANKGTITVKSEVGKGTTFTVLLPTAEGQVTDAKSQ